MLIKVAPRKSYGNLRYYADNEVAEKLMVLFKRKCFTRNQLQELKDVGFIIEVITADEEYKIV